MPPQTFTRDQLLQAGGTVVRPSSGSFGGGQQQSPQPKFDFSQPQGTGGQQPAQQTFTRDQLLQAGGSVVSPASGTSPAQSQFDSLPDEPESQAPKSEHILPRGKGAPTGIRILNTLGDISGQGALGEVVGGALAKRFVRKTLAKSDAGAQETLQKAQQALRRERVGGDPARIKTAQRAVHFAEREMGGRTEVEDIVPKKNLRQIVGAVGESALGFLTAGAGSAAIKGVTKAPLLLKAAKGLSVPNLLKTAGSGVVKQSAKLGAKVGAAEGLFSGLQKRDATLGSVLGSTAFGTALGGAGGAIGGKVTKAIGKRTKLLPKIRKEVSVKNAVKNITPSTDQLSSKQFKDLSRKRLIKPKTFRSPDEVILSPRQLKAVERNSELIVKDPIKTRNNLEDAGLAIDKKVGKFLNKNNGIFNRGELENALTKSLDDLTDLTVTPKALSGAKKKVIESLLKDLQKNDYVSLWKLRKNFDKRIKKAFSGSPSLSKEAKIELRNAIQDFISKKTDNRTYKKFMREISDLFDLEELVEIKAVKNKGRSGLSELIRKHPKAAKVVGGVVVGGAAASGLGKITSAIGN